MAIKVGMVSLGCPKNQMDAELMLAKLEAAGFEITAESGLAQVVIVNTCGFIADAKQESIENILEFAQLKKEKQIQKIIVTGCLAQRYQQELAEEIPECDGVIGLGANEDIVEVVNRVMAGETVRAFPSRDSWCLDGDRLQTTPHFFAYLRIADGCNNRCTYCAIPSIRGKFRSRPIEDLINEAKDLDALGVRELCIIAQDTTRYGEDLYGEYSLHTLLRRLTEETEIPWFRLLYCYPDKITDELISEMRDNDRIVKYIDMPLQHISDRILKAMNRRGDSSVIKNVIEKLRREIPDIVIRTTFIVGFPGETDEDFEQLCDFVHNAGFDRAGVFAYSREEGTPAYSMKDQIDEQVKQDRLDVIMRDQLEINTQMNESKVGKTVTVIYEGFDELSQTHFGRSYADAPEIDGKVYFKLRKRVPLEVGDFVNVKITEALDYDLMGVLISK